MLAKANESKTIFSAYGKAFLMGLVFVGSVWAFRASSLLFDKIFMERKLP